MLLALPASMLIGYAFAGAGMALTTWMRSWQDFEYIQLAIMPMFLFSGTFFPVEQLPAVVRPLAWISPLWHGTELARAAALDRWALLPALGHLAFLAALLALGVGLSARLFTRRLAQ